MDNLLDKTPEERRELAKRHVRSLEEYYGYNGYPTYNGGYGGKPVYYGRREPEEKESRILKHGKTVLKLGAAAGVGALAWKNKEHVKAGLGLAKEKFVQAAQKGREAREKAATAPREPVEKPSPTPDPKTQQAGRAPGRESVSKSTGTTKFAPNVKRPRRDPDPDLANQFGPKAGDATHVKGTKEGPMVAGRKGVGPDKTPPVRKPRSSGERIFSSKELIGTVLSEKMDRDTAIDTYLNRLHERSYDDYEYENPYDYPPPEKKKKKSSALMKAAKLGVAAGTLYYADKALNRPGVLGQAGENYRTARKAAFATLGVDDLLRSVSSTKGKRPRTSGAGTNYRPPKVTPTDTSPPTDTQNKEPGDVSKLTNLGTRGASSASADIGKTLIYSSPSTEPASSRSPVRGSPSISGVSNSKATMDRGLHGLATAILHKKHITTDAATSRPTRSPSPRSAVSNNKMAMDRGLQGLATAVLNKKQAAPVVTQTSSAPTPPTETPKKTVPTRKQMNRNATKASNERAKRETKQAAPASSDPRPERTSLGPNIVARDLGSFESPPAKAGRRVPATSADLATISKIDKKLQPAPIQPDKPNKKKSSKKKKKTKNTQTQRSKPRNLTNSIELPGNDLMESMGELAPESVSFFGPQFVAPSVSFSMAPLTMDSLIETERIPAPSLSSMFDEVEDDDYEDDDFDISPVDEDEDDDMDEEDDDSMLVDEEEELEESEQAPLVEAAPDLDNALELLRAKFNSNRID